MRREYKHLCPTKIITSIMAANMWKNSLKNYNLITIKFYTKPYSIFFLQRNGTYCLNKTRIMYAIGYT